MAAFAVQLAVQRLGSGYGCRHRSSSTRCSIIRATPRLRLGHVNDNTARGNDLGQRRKNKKRTIIASGLILLNVLFGLGFSAPRDGVAAAAEEPSSLAKQDDSPQWQTSSELSDKLFQSLSKRPQPSRQSPRENYWGAQQRQAGSAALEANERLIDNVVATISTMYYDTSGGFLFDSQSFYKQWKTYKRQVRGREVKKDGAFASLIDTGFSTREDAVKSLKAIVNSLDDPYSKYLTREELKAEYSESDGGFLGLGMIVESSPPAYSPTIPVDLLAESDKDFGQAASRNRLGGPPANLFTIPVSKGKRADFLSVSQAQNLPQISAVIPDSPAERAGLTVGDKIASVGDFRFTGLTSQAQTQKKLDSKEGDKYVFRDGWYRPKQRVAMDLPLILGYRTSRIKSIPTTLTARLDTPTVSDAQGVFPSVVGGDSIVHYQLLTSKDSIFQQVEGESNENPVGYIRLTRFSRASTEGYVRAVEALESAGATSYIIDLRNNYGGHVVLCYTLNSRGGFKPQENQEYIVDMKYPGYLLSSERSDVSRNQVKSEHPEYLEDGGWTSPTSYASEQEGGTGLAERKEHETIADVLYRKSQKNIVLLVNEGTASSAEVFASSLRDNGRITMIGTRTFGKGLIQHTFPLEDGGGLRLTVAEYLTPSLQHVTKVFGARLDSGVEPDIRCESKEGIPQNVGSDICVGVALDVLDSQG
ncbi:hypothetical protein THAOC_23590 [Thalassiosira oceanica]|uniref:PDZ domain-containing protein n=1 Tax=Thalassiosira oceanica TaxID=159749 RepID=K0S6H7_THAOC|nr:hypothetical protein THAOC_23590 [Thalassiosira oceanica]|eukprot:EJK56506.1 hypothetical protein THAOC_23590 [Thalassiosira oceanica]